MVNIVSDDFTAKKLGKSGQVDYLIKHRFTLDRLACEMFKDNKDREEFKLNAIANPFITMMYLKQYEMADFEKIDKIINRLREKRGQISLIVGHKGSGKTYLAWWLCKQLYDRGEKIWYFGPPSNLPEITIGGKKIPLCEGSTLRFENIPSNVTVFVGEAGVQFYNQGVRQDKKIETIKHLPLLRHQGRNLIWETQSTAITSINFFRLTDAIFFKSYSPFQFETERFTISDELKFFMPTIITDCLYYDNHGIMSFSYNKGRWWEEEYSTPYSMFKNDAEMYKFVIKLSKECESHEIKEYLSIKNRFMKEIEIQRVLMIIKQYGMDKLLSWKDNKIIETISQGFDDTPLNLMVRGKFKRIKCNFEMTNIQTDYWKEKFMRTPQLYLNSQLNYNQNLLDDLEFMNDKCKNVNINILGDPTDPTGSGKCQPKGSKVMMANGEWKNIEDIEIGDLVISPQKDGTNMFSKVVNTTSWYSNENYNIHQLNRQKKKLYSCTHNHLIPTYHKVYPRINGIQSKKNGYHIIKNYTAGTLSKMSKNEKAHNNIGFSSFAIEKFNGRENCEIEPYTLGVYLGDGHFLKYKRFKNGWVCTERQLGITSSNESIMNEIMKKYKPIRISKKEGTTAKAYHFGLKNKLAKLLTKYNLSGKKSGNKFIPKEALLSNFEYRKKLLAGLIDTDGYYAPRRGGYQFTLKSKQLIEDIYFLVYSLGGRCGKIRKVTKTIKSLGFIGTYYSLSFYLGDMELPLKLDYKKKDTNSIYLSSNRIAINVIKSEPSMVYGFELDSTSKSKWYITDNFMVTHNSLAGISFADVIGFITKSSFEKDNVYFGREDFLNDLKNMKPNTIVLLDDLVAVHGTGSGRSEDEMKNAEQVLRKKRIHFIFTSPEERFSHLSNFILQSYGIDYEREISRFLVYSKDRTMLYGYITLKRPNIKIETEYEKKKKEFLESVTHRETSKKDWNVKAEKLVKHPLWQKAKNKDQRLAICNEVFPNLGSGEARMVVAAAEMVD